MFEMLFPKLKSALPHLQNVRRRSKTDLEKRAKCAARGRRRPCNTCKVRAEGLKSILQTCKTRGEGSAQTLQHLQNARRGSKMRLADVQSARRGVGAHFARFSRYLPKAFLALCFLPVHPFVDDGDDESIEEGRCEQAAEDNFRHWALDFVARQVTAQGERNQCQCR